MTYELVIWLEIHLKLNSTHKLFCTCLNVQEFDELPANTHICPVCTGQPGELPVLNEEPLQKAVELGLALGCHISPVSLFDRKSYFYPDLPMWFQITQQSAPTCIDGEVEFYVDDAFTQIGRIRIANAHIEIDTWKSTHASWAVYLDFNRSGTPLVEIVTHPDFRSADEVISFLKELQRIARYQQVSNAEMESGQMRCDVNISLRPQGQQAFNTRVELKNMNSFSAVRRAIDYEYARQQEIYENNWTVDQETRGWDDVTGTSYVMRSKENAMDYRYMPDPDLPPLVLEEHWIDTIRAQVVHTPFSRMRRYKEEFGFNKEYINGLISDLAVNTYFEQLLTEGMDPKLAATWIVWPIASRLTSQETTIDRLPFSYEYFKTFLQLQQAGTLITQHAKTVLQEMLQTGKDPQTIIEEKGLKPIDPAQLEARVDELFASKPELLTDLRAGNMKLMGFVTGQVMKMSWGAADPSMLQTLIQQKISQG